MKASNSVGHVGSIWQWITENYAFFRMRASSTDDHLDEVLSDIDSAAALYEEATGREFAKSKLLEIGYGARPNRLIAMLSMGIDARGIDLDQPVLKSPISSIFLILQKNGFKRAVKTTVRHFLFDRQERYRLATSLRKRGHELSNPVEAFHVGNAATYDFGSTNFDLIFSQDVFEHIPPSDLKLLVQRLVYLISEGGILLITPHLYPGIAGSHLPEWYPHAIQKNGKNTEPWEHLRKRRVRADCYLNELRLQDYRDLFNPYFEIIKEISQDGDLGSDLLTSEILSELPSFSKQELLLNRVTFVLKKRESSKSL